MTETVATPSVKDVANPSGRSATNSPATQATGPPGDAIETRKNELSGKEMKRLAKAEKAARRAKDKDNAAKSGAQQQPQVPAGQTDNTDGVRVKSAEPPKTGPAPSSSRQTALPARRRPSQSAGKEPTLPPSKPKAQKQVAFLAHLYGQPRRHTISDASKDVHPMILTVAQQIAHYRICGSHARTVAMMVALKAVIATYVTPLGTSLPRHLSSHFLSPQLSHLKAHGRPFCTAQSAAIRWLKNAIATLDPSLPEHEAKNHILHEIDTFIHERFAIADQVIAEEVASHRIQDGDVVLCYGKSAVVVQSIREAVKQGKKFLALIADARPLREGKALARSLQSLNKSVQANNGRGHVEIIYTPLTALASAVYSYNPTLTLLGAHTVLGNGAIQARAGTALVALLARDAGARVLVLSEGIKFAERVSVDGTSSNELAPEEEIATDELKGWRDLDKAHVANLMYDVTPPELVDAVVSELGTLPPGASLSIVRLVGSVGETVV